MSLDVVGAGLGRTGTNSLKLALERLLGAPCYDMSELLKHPDHVPVWEQALNGQRVDWETLFADHRATVDWTAAAFFSELAAAYPDAIVVLSVRDADDWWRSVERTVVPGLQSEPPPADAPLAKAWAPGRRFNRRMLAARFTDDWSETAAKEAFLRHNAEVRATIPVDRLVEWRPGDGWAPLCAALRLSVPLEPFPHVNTTDEFRATFRLDPPLKAEGDV
jgi:Sulfotransferase domain